LGRFVGAQLPPEPPGQREFSLIQSRRLPDHKFRDLDVLVDSTNQKLQLACVQSRC
jgi:hypothetical protein